jgi:dynein heavy chain
MIHSNPKFIEELKSFDKDHIPDSVISKIDEFANNPEFTPDKINNASKACKALCMWVLAMHTYHYVAKDVEPKKVRLAAAQESLDITLAGNAYLYIYIYIIK